MYFPTQQTFNLTADDDLKPIHILAGILLPKLENMQIQTLRKYAFSVFTYSTWEVSRTS